MDTKGMTLVGAHMFQPLVHRWVIKNLKTTSSKFVRSITYDVIDGITPEQLKNDPELSNIARQWAAYNTKNNIQSTLVFNNA